MLTSKVVRRGDALLLEVDGKPIPPMAYVTYNPAEGRYGQFAGAGVTLFSAAVYMGDRGINSSSGIRPFRPGFWLSQNEYDFSAVEQDFRRIIGAVPDALIFPRIHFDVPAWWESAHPDDAARDFHGMPLRQSFASARWIADCRRALERYYDWLARSGLENHVAGCQVAAGGTEEWYYHQTYPGQLLDYSEANRAAFAAWLERRYDGDLQAWKAAWRQGSNAFAEAAIPMPLQRSHALGNALRDETLEAPAIDYAQYHSHAVAKAIAALCGHVKQVTGSRHAAGAFYGYCLENSSPDFGHHALGEALACPDLDFLASPVSYTHSRAMGMDWPMMAPVESVMAHGKLWFIEADVRTCHTRLLKESMPFAAPKGNDRYETAVWSGPETVRQSLGAMGKVFARALTHNTALWWFDMWAGWYNDPELMGYIGLASGLYGQVLLDGGTVPCAQIAVIVDEAAFSRVNPANGELRLAIQRQRVELGFLGAPYHAYLAADIEILPVEHYRMIVFLNAARIGRRERKIIANRYQADGRMLVWLGLPDEPAGETTGYGCAEQVSPSQQADSYSLLQDDHGVQLAVIRHDSHIAAISARPCLEAQALRELALLAGVHIYCHSGEVVYASRDYVAIHAASGGVKRICFPGRTNGMPVAGPATAFSGSLYHDFPMETGDTALWRICPAADRE